MRRLATITALALICAAQLSGAASLYLQQATPREYFGPVSVEKHASFLVGGCWFKLFDVAGDVFSLRSLSTGRTYGPFVYKDSDSITIDRQTFTMVEQTRCEQSSDFKEWVNRRNEKVAAYCEQKLSLAELALTPEEAITI